MPKRDAENYQQYKERVIDRVSPSFCAAKWYNATIWLGSGMTTSCHHPLPHKVNADEVRKNPKLLHNTPHKKQMRRLMQKGERPPECEYCWKIEDIGRNNVSDRVFKTILYSDQAIDEAASMEAGQDVNLKTLEIAFDRVCNFACSYCNPAFSSTWVKDIRKNGPYVGLSSDGRNHFTHPHDSAQPFRPDEENPYIQAFWKWWPELSESLMELRVTGGEPTLSGDFWKLLDWFKDHFHSKMRFAMNSNLGMKPDILDRLIDRSRYIQDFHVYTSNESVGAQAEYIRDGLNWNAWTENVERLLGEGGLKGFHMMMTINALSLFSLPAFLDQLLVWKRRFGRDFPTWSVNILRFPSFQSALVLSPDLRTERREALQGWLDRHGADPMIHESEKVQLQRLIDYLDVVKTPHLGASAQSELQRDFRAFYEQYDRRRGKSLKQVFSSEPSEFLRWYESIPLEGRAGR